MKFLDRKPKVLTPEQAEEIYTKDFFDMILPSTIKFFTDYCHADGELTKKQRTVIALFCVHRA